MKIAFLNIFNGQVERGSEIFVSELARQLGKKNKVVVYQTGKKTSADYTVSSLSGIPFIPHQSYSGSSNHLINFLLEVTYHLLVLLFTLRCLPKLWKEKFDWIIPVNGASQVLLVRILRFLRGGKVLISGHAGVGQDDYFNLTIGNPDIFIALTPRAYSWAKEIGRGKKIYYIPNGINLTTFRPDIKPVKLGLPKPIILTVGALVAYKKIDLTIRAVEKLRGVALLVIGDGPLREEIKNLGNKLLGERFQLMTYVPHEKMPRYYQAADIFTLASDKQEAFGLAYLEAMACNIPVVSPDDENRKQLIGEAGLFFTHDDMESYSKVLRKALLKDFNNKPRDQAKKYSWEKIAAEYEKIFNKY